MAATPLTTECRAIVERLRAFPSLEGNAQYLRRLIYEDSATLTQLIPVLEAVAPPESDEVQALYRAAATVGSVGEGGGNVGLWPHVQTAADAITTACDLVEADAPEAPEGSSS